MEKGRDEAAAEADAAAKRLEDAYGKEELKALIANGGRAV